VRGGHLSGIKNVSELQHKTYLRITLTLTYHYIVEMYYIYNIFIVLPAINGEFISKTSRKLNYATGKT